MQIPVEVAANVEVAISERDPESRKAQLCVRHINILQL